MQSSDNPIARSASPVDEDLQKLYNEVWAGFAEESNANTDGDLDTIYNVYGNSDYTSPNAVDPSANGQSPNPSRSQPLPQRPPPPPSLPSASSQKSAQVRRLPPTPGSTVSSPASATFSMPEPEHYPQRPSHYTTDSYASTSSSASHDLLRKATAGSSSRKLPPAPGSLDSNRPTGPNWPSGLPVDPRPTSRAQTALYQESLNSPGSTTSTHSSSLSRNHSTRPPGALPPTPPGGNYLIDDSKIYQSPAIEHYPHDAGLSTPVDYNRANEDKPVSFPTPTHAQEPPSQTVPADYPSPGSTWSNSVYEPYLGRSDSASSYATPQAYAYQPAPSGSSLHRGDSAGSYISSAALQGQAAYSSVESPNVNPEIEFPVARGPLELHDTTGVGYWDEDEEEDAARFINYSLLSHIAVQLRDKIPRGTHVKGSIPYPRSFTGKEIVSTIQSIIQRELAINHGMSTSDRRAALQVARSLQSQLFFYEVEEWGNRPLQDGVEEVYMFLDDPENADGPVEREELPTGVITVLTRCYSASCGEGVACYAYDCPRKGNSIKETVLPPETQATPKKESWAETVKEEILQSLPESEINRQTIIHKIITKEEQYIQDLDIIESTFLKPLRTSNPPVIDLNKLEEFIDDVFGNVLDLRECNRRLLEVMFVRQREQGPIIQRIGDVFLEAATEFRLAYPIYIGHLPIAEKRLKEETENNAEFRLFLEHCARQQSTRQNEAPRLDLKHLLNRPSEHLQKYPVLLEAVMKETAEGNPDADFLREACDAIKNLQAAAQLRTFQCSMAKGNAGKWEWDDLVTKELIQGVAKKEAKKQHVIFELIKGEMAYVRDLENIELMYIRPLRESNPPIMDPQRLETFIEDVFHNFSELHSHHRRLIENLHEIQREEHPFIKSITAPLFDAALNWRDAYMKYIPHYPIAAYRIDEEMATNPAFKAFVDQAVRHPDADRLDMKNFINRPIPRLLRYELLLKSIMDELPEGHEDLEAIPNVIEVIKSLGKETEPGVVSAKQKVELWRYNTHLVFKNGETVDMDLLNDNRSLMFSGKLLRQPDSGLEWNGWSELFVLLFDNYLVMTKPKEKDGVTKFYVNRRPIPLDLLNLVNFNDPGTQRSAGLLRGLRGGGGGGHDATTNPAASPEDSRMVYPFTIHHNGRLGGPYTFYAESPQARLDWKAHLEQALALRKAVQDSNKVFEIEKLSTATFLMPSAYNPNSVPTYNQETTFTGKVTCSVPFNTPDGRGLVAIGCAEGVWIGYRHDPTSMRRVLHLKMVTQCAMLEEFGIFLVLADKSLFAYHIEALVPTSPQGVTNTQAPQKLNGTKDVHFFSVGTLHGRTLIVYMKKKGVSTGYMNWHTSSLPDDSFSWTASSVCWNLLETRSTNEYGRLWG
ncbi:hypothetical protein AX16_001369 [Volvariella volvacea WC 439]|nr:hypothetical protein AX16_001369 [Volvariella volvacea WC 439]